MDRHVIGKCSICGGLVTIPSHPYSINSPTPKCESCGAYVDKNYSMPVVPMKPVEREMSDKWRKFRL